jgi:hypothetical protein
MAGMAQQARRMAYVLPMGRNARAVRERIEAAEKLLERAFVIPRINQPVRLDAALGAIPFIGDVADFFYRSNSRNLKMVRRHLDRHHPGSRIIDA